MFTAHTRNKQQELSRCLFKLRHTCVINSVIGKGIEPHPTNGLVFDYVRQKPYLTFLSTLEGVMRSLLLSPRHAVQVEQGSQSLSTLYLYYIKSNQYCQVFFAFILFFFAILNT